MELNLVDNLSNYKRKEIVLEKSQMIEYLK